MAIFLSIIMFLSFLPLNAEGKGFVKEVDALFSNLELKVNGNRISGHKEPFIYDQHLWVSISDLAKGLDLGIKINGNGTVYLNSKNKLNVDIDKSKLPDAFQKGYEIEAKERIIDILEEEMKVVEGKTPSSKSPSSNKNDKLKNINVGFGNTTVYLDGKKLNLNAEPLKYKNEIYVPLDNIAPYLYITPSLNNSKTSINIDANGILIKDSNFPSLTKLIGFREGRNYLLNLQIEELEKRKYVVEQLRIPYKRITDVKSLEKYLNDNFSACGDLRVELKVTEQRGNWMYLDISFPYSSNSSWYKLQRVDVEDWIWDMYTAMVNLYNEDILISGAVRNPSYTYNSISSNKNYITFNSRDKDIYFDFTNSRLKRDNRINPTYLAESLNNTLKKYSNTNFAYEVSMNGDTANIIVHPSSNDFLRWSLYAKMGYLKRLNSEVKRVYPDLVIDGKIVFPNEKNPPYSFHIEENRVRSVDLLRETEEQLERLYGSFSYGNYDFNLKYSIYEKGLKDFHLIVEGNFSINDDKWIKSGSTGEERLSNNVHNALSYIISLWDVNVFTEVFDKNMVVIKEFDIYQENVSIVYANPSDGEITEGTEVRLYTDTSDADIYYTLDGSTPTTSSNLYTKPIVINRDVEINAFGYKEGLGAGPISTFKYKVVLDKDMSYGLTNLVVDNGSLSPSFSRNIYDYEVNISSDVDSISLTPYANDGKITINGAEVSSGSSKSVSLDGGRNKISISVKEANKKERIYTINVYKGTEGATDISIVNLKFDTTVIGIFKGRLSSNKVKDFTGYKVELLSKAGTSHSSTTVSSGGEFEITNFPVDIINKIIGYKYRIYDGGGKLILESNLN